MLQYDYKCVINTLSDISSLAVAFRLTTENYVVFSTIIEVAILLFVFGIVGLLTTRSSVLLVIIALELVFLGLNIFYVVSSVYLDDAVGVIFALVMLSLVGAESALALALLIVYYRLVGSIALYSLSELKG